VNLCLYITERGKGERVAQYTTKRAKRKSEKSNEFVKKPDIWILGKEIKLSKELVLAASSQAQNSSAWSVTKRFVVRGHWKSQACGPGMTLRKRIFVQPYWKGPKEGEKLAHLYLDGSEK